MTARTGFEAIEVDAATVNLPRLGISDREQAAPGPASATQPPAK